MRFDLQLIPQWIAPGSRVLDLGCGNGALLTKLIANNQVDGIGIEIDADHITECIAKGLNVIELDLNKGLGNLQDNSFDIVVMAHALQTLRSPHMVIDEMLRVGRECIVTFPNFAHWSCRLHLGQQGQMPVSKSVEESGFRMIGAHTDSPCLKVKPNPEIVGNGYVQLGVQVYGGVLLAPWFDRDLSLAGRVSFLDDLGNGHYYDFETIMIYGLKLKSGHNFLSDTRCFTLRSKLPRKH